MLPWQTEHDGNAEPRPAGVSPVDEAKTFRGRDSRRSSSSNLSTGQPRAADFRGSSPREWVTEDGDQLAVAAASRFASAHRCPPELRPRALQFGTMSDGLQ